MSLKHILSLLAVLAVAFAIVACGSDPTPTAEPPTPVPANAPEPTAPPAESVYVPVTIESCTAITDDEGNVQTGTASFTYSEPPSRAITMNQHVTLALELQDRMVGMAYIDDEILPQYQAAYQSVPVLAEEYPSKEVVLAQNPDFIYGGLSQRLRR